MNLRNVTLTTSERKNWTINVQHNEESRKGHYRQLVPQFMFRSVWLKLLNTTVKLPTLSVRSSEVSDSDINSQGLTCMHTALCPTLTTGLTEEALGEKERRGHHCPGRCWTDRAAGDAEGGDLCQCKQLKAFQHQNTHRPRQPQIRACEQTAVLFINWRLRKVRVTLCSFNII